MAVKKVVLVTGGAGFIGSHLVEALINKGHKVVVIDNLSHGNKKWLSPQAILVKQDVRDKNISKVFKQYSPEYVYHLAAQQDVGRANKDPVFDASVNILGTLNLLECARRFGVKRVIYADSVAGFGEPEELPIKANHSRNPISFYGISKHTAEHYLMAYQRMHKLDFAALVLANVYGPRQDPLGEGGVVAIFAHKMNNNLPITINGSGEQTRDFIYVYDVARAMTKAMRFGKNQFLMVGTAKKTNVNKLFEMMKRMTKYSLKPVYGPVRPGDVKDSVFSVAKTKRVLKWKPTMSLTNGLREMFEFREKF